MHIKFNKKYLTAKTINNNDNNDNNNKNNDNNNNNNYDNKNKNNYHLDRERLILAPSFSLSPVAPVLSTLSLQDWLDLSLIS